MTIINTTGNLTTMLFLSDGTFDDAMETNWDYFADHFGQVVYDVLSGNGYVITVTSTYLKAHLYGANGNGTFVGTGFYGSSGTISSIGFIGDGGSFSVQGNARWSAAGLTGTITSIQTQVGTEGFQVQGSFKIDAGGNLVGTMTRQVVTVDNYTLEYLGNISLATGEGTLTYINYHDNLGNSLVVNCNLSASAYQALVDSTSTADEMLNSSLFFGGNDVLNVVDASRAWHGFGGQDIVNGGNLADELYGDAENDTVFGFSGDDALFGGDGDDILDGGTGADILRGGSGNDIYIVDNSLDQALENGNEGIDTVRSSVSYNLGTTALEVENLTLTGSDNINASGNDLNNILMGNAANNRLDGGLGADLMMGDAGNDTYVVDNAGDLISDKSGIDTVEASITYTLGRGLENLTLTGLTGLENLNGTGNTGINILTGNAGNNILDGGKGNDFFYGGDGDDTYVVDSIGDIINELSNNGADTVLSSVSFVLGLNIENLTLTGTRTASATGNEVANILIGNTGANILDGGIGADSMYGGLGKDTYIVDDAGDFVEETSALTTEIDTVKSYIDYTLGNNLEALVLMSPGHTGTGNALNNILTGSGGDDVLDGGAGSDKLSGGLGNDTYIVDNIKDALTETSSTGGTDTVRSSVDWTLGSNFENLILEGAAIKGTGNTVANALTGNGNQNTLSGMSGNDVLDGGANHDVLIGGSGADTFVFSASFDDVSDTITDFKLTDSDKLDISDLLIGFDPLTSVLEDFVQISNNGLESILTVDRDGSGGAYSQVQVAVISGATILPDEAALVSTGNLIVT